MNADKDCELCGGKLEVECYYQRRELVCIDCGSIIDSEYYGEEMEPEETDLEVMQ